MIEKLKESVQDLPEKKKYFEVITAILSVPILITVLITNTNNLRHQNANANDTKVEGIQTTAPPAGGPTSVKERIVTIVKEGSPAPTESEESQEPTVQPTQTIKEIEKQIVMVVTATPAECKKEIGPTEIVSPHDGEVITTNPFTIDIGYKTGEYCPVSWSYRMNGGEWSVYSTNDIEVYSLPPGEKQLEVKVKSTVTNQEIILKRSFSYKPPEASSSASLTQ